MIVRSATFGDRQFLTQAILGISLRSRLGGVGVLVEDLPAEVGSREISIADWHLSHTSAFALLCVEDQDMIGCIFGHVGPSTVPWSNRIVGHISVCWVEPAYRRQGIALLLVKAAEEQIRSRGVKIAELAYNASSEEAEATWSGAGYVPFRVYATKDL
ncbi:MAG: GNAT family N-acetyltransferase [Actinomycetota bacterium]